MKRIVTTSPQRRLLISWVMLIVCIAVFVIALLIPLDALGLTDEEAALQEAYESGQIIRLHILAEDDSPRAQQTKLAVRDAVLAAFGEELARAGAKDAQAVYSLLATLQPDLLVIAKETANACGFYGSVTVQLGRMELPQKAYGDVVLPAGEYRALRITIGKGVGQNWWCVLFPQLCLALAEDDTVQPIPAPAPSKPKLYWRSLDVFRHWPMAVVEGEGMQE